MNRADYMDYFVSFSGGKDSTAMLLRLVEEGWPITEIIFSDTGMEYPQTYAHIDKVEQYIGRPIVRLQPTHSFEEIMFDHVYTRGPNKGLRGKGWPTFKIRWCTGFFKETTINSYLKKYLSRYKHRVQYIGFSTDEIKRSQRGAARGDRRYPLIGWDMSGDDALTYCRDRGFHWDGLYDYFDRVSCWCCPLQSTHSLRILWRFFPELWARLKEMDSRARNRFKPDATVAELEERFLRERLELQEKGGVKWDS